MGLFRAQKRFRKQCPKPVAGRVINQKISRRIHADEKIAAENHELINTVCDICLRFPLERFQQVARKCWQIQDEKGDNNKKRHPE